MLTLAEFQSGLSVMRDQITADFEKKQDLKSTADKEEISRQLAAQDAKHSAEIASLKASAASDSARSNLAIETLNTKSDRHFELLMSAVQSGQPRVPAPPSFTSHRIRVTAWLNRSNSLRTVFGLYSDFVSKSSKDSNYLDVLLPPMAYRLWSEWNGGILPDLLEEFELDLTVPPPSYMPAFDMSEDTWRSGNFIPPTSWFAGPSDDFTCLLDFENVHGVDYEISTARGAWR